MARPAAAVRGAGEAARAFGPALARRGQPGRPPLRMPAGRDGAGAGARVGGGREEAHRAGGKAGGAMLAGRTFPSALATPSSCWRGGGGSSGTPSFKVPLAMRDSRAFAAGGSGRAAGTMASSVRSEGPGHEAVLAEAQRVTLIEPPSAKGLSSAKTRPVLDSAVKSVEATPAGVSVQWADGDASTYHYEWLHRNRPETHLSCGQNTQSPCVVPPADVQASKASLSPDGSIVRVVWGAGPDVSMYKASWLREYAYSKPSLAAKGQQRAAPFASTIGSVRYADIMRDDAHVREWLEIINRDGLCVVRDVPVEDNQVIKVASRIGGIMPTIYGLQWDVRTVAQPIDCACANHGLERHQDLTTVAQPINCAYTNHGLDLHQDLAYYESPPGIQLLHCLRFDESIIGGLSTFADAFQVANLLRARDPEAFETLTKVPATFQKIHYDRPDPVHIEYRRPHIETNSQGDVINVFWSPAFEGPLEAPSELVPAYYKAYRKFAEITQEEGVLLKFRLKPGELVTFSNRRLLHGRTAFSEGEGAVRHLQGCYVTIETYINRLRVLQNREGDPTAKRLSGVQLVRCSNGDFS